jgi:DNA-3-methyladenine glycosylase II
MEYTKILKKDPVMRALIKSHGYIPLSSKPNAIVQLYCAVVGQQLSTKAAAAIKKRFLDYYTKDPSPEQILNTPVADLRTLGLSNAKATYIHNIATFTLDNKLTHQKLKKLTDNEIITLLTQIKGIGQWTVEMLLMFTLERENVFPIDDLGIQKAMIQHYEITETNKRTLKKIMTEISESWHPYKTYASLHLWESLK